MTRRMFSPQADRRHGDDATRQPAVGGFQGDAAAERVSRDINRPIDADGADRLLQAVHEIGNRRERLARQRRRQSKAGDIERNHSAGHAQMRNHRVPDGVRHADSVQENERRALARFAKVPRTQWS